MATAPIPSQSGHAPSARLNVNSNADRPVSFANTSRIRSNTFVYVAGFDRGLLPSGFWSTATARIGAASKPEQPTGECSRIEASNTSRARVVLPAPDGPV